MAKYIITRDGSVVVFSEAMRHSDFKHFNPISAGFIYFQNQKAICSGESTSLNLKSRAIDTRLANSQIVH
jgi:hypothetical protein